MYDILYHGFSVGLLLNQVFTPVNVMLNIDFILEHFSLLQLTNTHTHTHEHAHVHTCTFEHTGDLSITFTFQCIRSLLPCAEC
jgi:hypothetical protein